MTQAEIERKVKLALADWLEDGLQTLYLIRQFGTYQAIPPEAIKFTEHMLDLMVEDLSVEPAG